MKGTNPTQKMPQTAIFTLITSQDHRQSELNPIQHQNRPQCDLKENLDSKTSTQDRTHKAESPQLQLKDISNIALSESILCPEQGQCIDNNNSSGISIINMLERDRPETFPKELEPLNLDFHDENDILKKELEMKNRLIEKLMKENSILREEMEGLLTSLEEAKSPRNLKTQNFGNRILELEHQIVYLEEENKVLKEQLRFNSQGTHEKEAQMKILELQVGKYCESAKKEAEEFYLKFQQHLKFYSELSKHNFDDFSKTIKKQFDEIKTANIIPPLELRDQTKIIKSNSKPGSKDVKKNLLSFERRSHTEESLTPTSALPLSTRSNLSPNLSLSAKKVMTESAQFSNKTFKNFVPIDENPELVRERKSSTVNVKIYQVQNKLKKVDNEENIAPFRRNSTVHKSLNKETFSQKLNTNRSSNDKRK